MTGEAKKRGCQVVTCLFACLSCEDEMIDNEFVCNEFSADGIGCCCIDQGCSSKLSCFPTPIRCCGTQGQTCCLYGRSAFPCNDLTPMELGCCGIMCIDKKETIMKAEEEVRKQLEELANSNMIEATIVSGGAPAEEMVR